MHAYIPLVALLLAPPMSGAFLIRRLATPSPPKCLKYGNVRLNGLFGSDYETNNEDWQTGDVYADLDRLEMAITLTNAEQNLQHAERMELLRHFAQARHPLLPDVQKFVLFPFVLAMLLSKLTTTSNSKLKVLAHLFTTAMDWHFWIVVVASPLVLLAAKRITRPPPEPMPLELQELAPEYLALVEFPGWEEPERSTKDYVLCLLEFWTSAIAGMAVVGVAAVPWKPKGLWKLWFRVAQALTRLGAVAALYQYPKQMFRLQRAEQPRPVGFFATAMQQISRWMMVVLPLGLATDLSQILVWFGRESMVATYMTLATLLLGTWLRLSQHTEPLEFQQLKRMSFGRKILYILASIAFWKKPYSNLLLRLQQRPVAGIFSKKGLPRLLLFLKSSFLFTLGWVPIIAPLVHIRFASKLLRVVYTHDLSLAMNTDAFKASIEDDADLGRRMKWRYRLEWRDEKRLRHVWKEWKSNLGYWLLEEGTVHEKLEQESRELQEKEITSGKHILERLQKEVDASPDGNRIDDRDEWKPRAMKKVADFHQKDYDRGNYTDPLGVAVQQTFGIGLGFNFDHTRPLEPGERPSVRRLHARAAKSAIRRAQELYDAEEASEELDEIKDPAEQDLRAIQMRQELDHEIQNLARRLTELVPAGSSSDFGGTLELRQFHQRREYVRKSSHEMLVIDPDKEPPQSAIDDPYADILDIDVSEPAGQAEASFEAIPIEEIMGRQRGHENPESASGNTDTGSDIKDDEFVNALLRRKEIGDFDKGDDDNDEKIVLA